MKKTKFPLQHHVLEEAKEVWIVCSSSVTAMGIPSLMSKYYPGYKPCICSPDYFDELISVGG